MLTANRNVALVYVRGMLRRSFQEPPTRAPATPKIAPRGSHAHDRRIVGRARDAPGQSRKQIKQGKTQVPKHPFREQAEAPESKHVHAEMPKGAVQEHMGQQTPFFTRECPGREIGAPVNQFIDRRRKR